MAGRQLQGYFQSNNAFLYHIILCPCFKFRLIYFSFSLIICQTDWLAISSLRHNHTTQSLTGTVICSRSHPQNHYSNHSVSRPVQESLKGTTVQPWVQSLIPPTLSHRTDPYPVMAPDKVTNRCRTFEGINLLLLQGTRNILH
jgi:hypothetical protein